MASPSNKVGTIPIGQLFELGATTVDTVVANEAVTTFDLGHVGLREVMALFTVTAADTDAGDTLDVFLDAGTTGSDGTVTYYNFGHFTQITGDASVPVTYVLVSGALTALEESVASDVAAGGTPRTFFGDTIRVRQTTVDADANATFTYSLKLIVR